MVDWARHRKLYGTLDPFAVLPFVEEYGARLSPEGRRLARVLDRALRGESPLGRTVCFALIELLRARHDGRCHDVALHRQQLVVLLVRYARRRRRGRLPWTTPGSTSRKAGCSPR